MGYQKLPCKSCAASMQSLLLPRYNCSREAAWSMLQVWRCNDEIACKLVGQRAEEWEVMQSIPCPPFEVVSVHDGHKLHVIDIDNDPLDVGVQCAYFKEGGRGMIDNSDKIGNYLVVVYAAKNRVASFECPTLVDCSMEVSRIVSERNAKDKPTIRATARRMKGKSGRIRLYDDLIELDVTPPSLAHDRRMAESESG